MPRTDLLASPKRRLKRAKSKFGTLKRRGQIFRAKNPYALVTEPDEKSGREFYKFKITKKLPVGMQDLAWEVVEELRSVLDQIGYASAVASGKTKPKSAYFPIADSDIEWENVAKGRCKDLPPDILTLFRSFKPYQGGNDAVWTLNRLANGNKHRFIIPSGAVAEHSLHIRELHAVPGTEIPALVWDRVKREMIVMSAPIGSNLKYDLGFAVFIAFDEVEPVSGQPVIPILGTMIGEVERILLATEAEGRRIRLF